VIYRTLLKPLFFSLDPEVAHGIALKGASIGSFPPIAQIVAKLCRVDDKRLKTTLFKREFKHPLGLAAGFDKDGVAIPFLGALGFSYIEIGTVTPEAQEGNPKPRLWRFPPEKALINALGFPSAGARQVVKNLTSSRSTRGDFLLGINIGKQKSTSLDDAVKDYEILLSQLKELGDYVVINVSSPNTPELRRLQEPARLSELLQAIKSTASSLPLLLKVSPDLSFREVDELLKASINYIDGIIATNTTLSRERCLQGVNLPGGLSGTPLKVLSLQLVKRISTVTGGSLPIIGVGGVSSATDILDFIEAGASLVQLYSGLVFEGPLLVNRILRDLIDFCDKHHLRSIYEIRS
jgi:dihydroorotate dehydrogenase